MKRVCRAAVGTAVGTLIVLLIARAWLVEGLFIPVRVHGSSMAQTLRGSHWQLTCEDCGFVFRFGAESPPRADWAVCPNCGYQKNDARVAQPRRGDRVLLDKAALLLGRPQRWDMVAVRMPERETYWAVKRVVGLPDERISIRGGDIFANGRIVRKTPAQFREVAVLVHDDAHRPRKSQLPERWRPESEPNGWRRDDGQWAYRPDDAASDDAPRPALDWLGYHHLACLPLPTPRDRPSAVLDSLGYNQGLSRELHESGDLMLQVTLTATRQPGGSGGGVVALWLGVRVAGSERSEGPEDGRVAGDSDNIEVRIDLDRRTAQLTRGGQLLGQRELSIELFGRPMVLELGLVDRQWFLAVDGRPVLTHPLDDADRFASGLPALGAARCVVEIDRLRVFRDVHYLHPFGLDDDWSAEERLAADEYFLLGDNGPMSKDSRFWGKSGGLSQKQFIGRVVRLGR